MANEKKVISKPDFEWTQPKRQAAFLIALGQEPKTVIAKKVGVHRKTLQYWEAIQQFIQQVNEYREKILLQTDESLLRGISEQVFQIRHALNTKFKDAKEIKSTPLARLLTEYRKYMETALKVQLGGKPVQIEGNIGVTYEGKNQIEDLIKQAQAAGSDPAAIEASLLAIAGEIVADKEKEYTDDFPKM